MDIKDFVDTYYVERKNTNSTKWDLLGERFGDPDLLPIWVADMEFKAPDSVISALTERVQHGAYGYSFIPDTYYNTYSKWMEDSFGYKVTTKTTIDGVYIVAGGLAAFAIWQVFLR